MRVRLYEMGPTRSDTVYRIDRFPVSLSTDGQGDLFQEGARSTQGCLLENIDGVIYMQAAASEYVSVNEAPMRQGEILPGDRLQLGSRSFLVSYERIGPAAVRPTRYRISG